MKSSSRQITDNYKKHTGKNPLQKLLINNFFNALISLIKDLKIDSVLDVGCGEGFTLNKLYENKIGKRLEGIDYLKTAIALGKKLHPNLTLKQGDVYKLPFKDNSFDLIICTEVLEHLENPKEALREITRVSKKYVLLSVPNEPFFRLANFLRGKNITRFGNDIEHIQHWSSRGFQQFSILNSQFSILKVRHPFPWIMLILEQK